MSITHYTEYKDNQGIWPAVSEEGRWHLWFENGCWVSWIRFKDVCKRCNLPEEDALILKLKHGDYYGNLSR